MPGGGVYAFDGESGPTAWDRPRVHDGGVLSVAIHPSGVECSTASQDGRVLIWSAAEGQVSWVIEVGSGWVENSVGELVTAYSCLGRGPEGTLPGVLKSQVQPVTTLAFAPGAIRLASGGRGFGGLSDRIILAS